MFSVPALPAELAELQSGIARTIAPHIARLVAPNGSPMTGAGTNTYLLGDSVQAVLDPGPNDAAHLAAILQQTTRPTHIFVTHTHADHSPASLALARTTGARLVGRAGPADGRQDLTFVPDAVPADGQVFEFQGFTLRAIATPGHASNHICYLLQPGGILFSGDHLLDGVTPVILAPDGDMTAYLASLRRLLDEPIQAIAPGHGRLLQDPRELIEAVIAHRLQRERSVFEILGKRSRASVAELVPEVYATTPVGLHNMAALTLLAHLIKLRNEARVVEHDGIWSVVDR